MDLKVRTPEKALNSIGFNFPNKKTGFCEICDKFLSEKEFADNNKRCFECYEVKK